MKQTKNGLWLSPASLAPSRFNVRRHSIGLIEEPAVPIIRLSGSRGRMLPARVI